MAEQYAPPTPIQESPSKPLYLNENTEVSKGEKNSTQLNNTKENFDVFKRPDWVPKHWESKPAKKGNGMRYYNPDNKHDHVRIMEGDPAGTLAYRQQPFVKRARNGTYVDKNGKPIHSKMPEAHIPYEEFNYDKTS